MRKLGIIAVASLLLVGMIPLSASAQGYEPPPRANPKDIYCSGFIASSQYPKDLRIIGAEDMVGRLIYSENDYVYLSRGTNGGVAVGQRYMVVRRFNETNPVGPYPRQHAMMRSLGRIYHDIGWVEVKAVHETTSTALVTHACDALQMGDVLIPFEERPVPEYRPLDSFDRFAAPTGLAEGTVLIGKDFADTLGQGDVAYVNLGSGQGVKIGDYVRFHRWGRGTEYEGFSGVKRGQWRRYRGIPWDHRIPIETKVRNTLPRELLGEAMVVHVDQNTSTAIITFSLREIHAGDYVELQPAVSPQAQLRAQPERVTRGEGTTLSWTTTAANRAEINPGVGSVSRRGTQNVYPTQTTTYALVARGPGGSAEATATVTVVEPPRPPAPAMPAGPSLQDLFQQNVADIFFDFNRADIGAEAQASLERTAEFLRAHPDIRVLIEGHCDEVGGDDYNIRLGQRRADGVKGALAALGINAERLRTVSVGQARPFCTESSEEDCRQLNRRVHFVPER